MLFLSLFLVKSANGTITEEYEYQGLDSTTGSVFYRFKVEVIIETEKDGTWIPNNWYDVDYIITLEYINHSGVIDRIESLIFYDARLTDCSRREFYTPSSTDAMEWSGQTDVLAFQASVNLTSRLRVFPMLEINLTYVNEVYHLSNSWIGEKPIYIDKTPQSLGESLLVIIGIIVGVAIGAVSVLLGVKIGEKPKNRKTNQKHARVDIITS